jgi:PBP4 family serine-type D-alanyl-D-alanine carboxypeptidase
MNNTLKLNMWLLFVALFVPYATVLAQKDPENKPAISNGSPKSNKAAKSKSKTTKSSKAAKSKSKTTKSSKAAKSKLKSTKSSKATKSKSKTTKSSKATKSKSKTTKSSKATKSKSKSTKGGKALNLGRDKRMRSSRKTSSGAKVREAKDNRNWYKPVKIRAYPYRRPHRLRAIQNEQELGKEIDRILRNKNLKGAKVGVVVMTPEGRILFRHNAEQQYIPASNIKLLTTAAALHYLGPHYRFETKVYADSTIDANGVLKGNLYIVGGGDPSLRSEELWRISRDLYMLGLRRVTGRLYFDASLFDQERFGPGWEDHYKQPRETYRAYLAPIGALSLNYNTIAIGMHPALSVGQPGRIMLDPQSQYVQKITNKTTTTEANGRFRIRVRMLSQSSYREEVELTGTIPIGAKPRIYWRRISHPEWYTAFQFASFLNAQGIRISLWPRRKLAPKYALLLYTHKSRSLSILLQYVGKNSSNFTAEQITKMLGLKVYGKPGSWDKGVEAIKLYLESIGIPSRDYEIVNGSGLSRRNRLSPIIIAQLLRVMLKDFATRSEFLVSQAIAGFDGTLRHRMTKSPAAGLFRAKTGTLDGVSSLSGYVATHTQDLLIVAMTMNGRIRQGRHFRRAQNSITLLLARFSLKSTTSPQTNVSPQPHTTSDSQPLVKTKPDTEKDSDDDTEKDSDDDTKKDSDDDTEKDSDNDEFE